MILNKILYKSAMATFTLITGMSCKLFFLLVLNLLVYSPVDSFGYDNPQKRIL